MSLDDVTCLIPLYRSRRLLPRVFENIESHVAAGGHVICSDEHGLDDAAAQIAARFAGVEQVRVLSSDAGGNWVSNCNRLIEACRTPFFRILPHDDTALAPSTAIMAQVLRERPEVVVSHGWVRAETEDGTRLPQRDEPKFPLRPVDEADVFSAGFFWQGLYSGAFKAVMRRNVVEGGPLLIRPTKTLKHSERAWLFGYSLLGEFAFSEEAFMVKRYWSGSLTDAWKLDASDFIDAADVMAGFVDDLIGSEAMRHNMRINLYLNAVRRANWLDGLSATRPAFEAPRVS